MKPLILMSVLALLPATASAQTPPDARLRTLPYSPDAVTRLDGCRNFQTMISFAADEHIENVGLGDSSQWQVMPNKRGDLLFVKPLAEGTSKGVQETSRVTDRPALTRKCLEVLKAYRQPALVETFLPGREFTVGLLGAGAGARLIGVAEVTFKPGGDPSAYSYRNKMDAFDVLTVASDATAAAAGETALSAWRALGCRDAGRIDIRCDADGRPNFIEANPLAGLRPEWSELCVLAEQVGLSYDALIGAILGEAATRVTRR